VATCVDVMSITLATTVNSLSVKLAHHRGGDRPSVDLATVPRIEALIPAVTSAQDSATAGYVLLHLGMTCVMNFGLFAEINAQFTVKRLLEPIKTTIDN